MSKLRVSPDVSGAMHRAVLEYEQNYEDRSRESIGLEILMRFTPLGEDDCVFIMNAIEPIPVEIIWNRHYWAELER